MVFLDLVWFSAYSSFSVSLSLLYPLFTTPNRLSLENIGVWYKSTSLEVILRFASVSLIAIVLEFSFER